MLRSGFFNSKNHDRQYYASDVSYLFNSLIKDGVFSHIGDKFIARAGSGMQVVIPSGLAWFNSTWTVNDSDYVVNINQAPYVANYKRIDGIFLQVFPEDDIATRDNAIYYMAGTQTSGTPAKPVPTPSGDEIYVPLCYVTVAYNVTSITAANIENMVGKTQTPFVVGILDTVDANELLAQWDAQWNEWLAAKKAGADIEWNEWFETTTTNDSTMWHNWFESVKEDLATVEVGELKNKVDAITNMYVQDGTLFLPNTAASVSGGRLVLGLIV